MRDYYIGRAMSTAHIIAVVVARIRIIVRILLRGTEDLLTALDILDGFIESGLGQGPDMVAVPIAALVPDNVHHASADLLELFEGEAAAMLDEILLQVAELLYVQNELIWAGADLGRRLVVRLLCTEDRMKG